ncbi:NADPH-dependent FMN reductase [Marinomonas posidonica]|uniref:NADPH-dependent FMN reductase n=1 Tax=Marinomonas posidonica (strain CECT 7376 / NCIMB 14433 / IVIA-Po-181) TaxID=491952 RepID=F6CUW6_MARPP|nr:NAD(P)H-dependent oxidoreductase [Marinomonas posidonica]AEF55292.1 NADPH-dependent FMN reductase [Marinomonas posidonica IVIA-Po-181]
MKFLVFLGTVRNSTPPKPARLGVRVAKACLDCLASRFEDHEIELIDALDYPMEPVFKPHFAYVKGKAPSALDELADKIAAADGYIMVSPEYNHSMSPALANLLNHFGSSIFSYKPSAIVTYSAGQWGGMRAALGMRNFLAELGCLSVSAMVHIPKAQEVLCEDGSLQAGEDESAWFDYFGRSFYQLVWWAEATKQQRGVEDPFTHAKVFKTKPSQRNAP